LAGELNGGPHAHGGAGNGVAVAQLRLDLCSCEYAASKEQIQAKSGKATRVTIAINPPRIDIQWQYETRAKIA
jgi:hypothetical protein